MEWKTDWGLQARMGLTMLLLLALYVVFIGALAIYGVGLFWITLVMGLFMVGQLFFSDKLALRSMGAHEVSEEEYPELHAMIGRLAQQADLPKPTVAVADSRQPNAFATGRSQDNATVCVTRGIMDTLNQEELEGVLAHELTHVKNRDVMVMTIATFLSTLAFMIVRWGFLFTGGDDEGGAPVLVAVLVSLVVGIVSFLLVRVLSRYREYAADRGGAIITGRPSALASALVKIDGRMDRVPDDDLREQADMNAFFIIPIKSGAIGKLLSTHPSTEQRVERLKDMQSELETA
ncbi:MULTISPECIES: zinc metalloprotease HtpX [Halococcus]|uniref:Protease HtpX homolog n=1 Tax=Halococcus salifodinae DSM 8989 TaxID=1227456 RepID=M0NCL9_9EURY|nr:MULTISPECIES: zinc metalloprotease HtpX [Halococcus]EMA55318.1 heat shock protein HtpX [Halococcus salifodinae DSM 8989]